MVGFPRDILCICMYVYVYIYILSISTYLYISIYILDWFDWSIQHWVLLDSYIIITLSVYTSCQPTHIQFFKLFTSRYLLNIKVQCQLAEEIISVQKLLFHKCNQGKCSCLNIHFKNNCHISEVESFCRGMSKNRIKLLT